MLGIFFAFVWWLLVIFVLTNFVFNILLLCYIYWRIKPGVVLNVKTRPNSNPLDKTTEEIRYTFVEKSKGYILYNQEIVEKNDGITTHVYRTNGKTKSILEFFFVNMNGIMQFE